MLKALYDSNLTGDAVKRSYVEPVQRTIFSNYNEEDSFYNKFVKLNSLVTDVLFPVVLEHFLIDEV